MRKHMDRLLTRLAVARGAYVPTDALMLAVWDDDPPETAETTLRVMVYRLRRELGREAITNDHGLGYRLDPSVPLPERRVDARLFRPVDT